MPVVTSTFCPGILGVTVGSGHTMVVLYEYINYSFPCSRRITTVGASLTRRQGVSIPLKDIRNNAQPGDILMGIIGAGLANVSLVPVKTGQIAYVATVADRMTMQEYCSEHRRVSFIDAFLPSWRRPGKCILKYRARGYAYSIGKAPTNGERFPTGDDRLSSGPKHSAYITMDTTYRRHAAS
jgi:hypothetical protein